MRILLINPNTSTSLTALLSNAARRVASESTVLDEVTATRGVPYISTRSEALLAGVELLEILARRRQDYDAAIVAAFGDPGLGAARELFDLPVVGLAEAGMLTACMLGKRFAIVTFSTALGPWYRECLEWHGLKDRSAGIFTLDEPFDDIATVQGDKTEMLVRLSNRAITEGEADVIVLAGAPLAGLAAKVRDRLPVPVVDCAEAAMKQAEALAALRPAPPRAGTFRRPDPKSSIGLAPVLADYIAHRCDRAS
ncbi:MAG: aspartate/glutamate racemase family protein [Paracoccus sp. (in: a-proteobacteria)]|jgi:Asp/Glu/hydantoin racemase|uniref:aspartate/glutamate racemase family protein n=1 Tax=Paracoccus sp. TaxID=267 RepID=UPI00262943C2|nr:aspartate/glutamate racemase family protein [uncultured Paracoccus sp.]